LWKLRGQNSSWLHGDWTIGISKTGGGEIQTCQIAELGRRRGKSTWDVEPRLGLLGGMRRHENLHDIVGTVRFTSGFGAQLQFHDRSRAGELAQLQSAFTGSRVVVQSLQRKSQLDTRRGREASGCGHLRYRRAGRRGYALPFIIKFEEARLVERCHRRHHRFTHKSRKRGGAGFFRGRRFQDCDGRRRVSGRLGLRLGQRTSLYLLIGTLALVRPLKARIRGVVKLRGTPTKRTSAWRSELLGWLGLKEPGQCELLVLFLVLPAVSLRAELAPTP
jgi:hypothetical protein